MSITTFKVCVYVYIYTHTHIKCLHLFCFCILMKHSHLWIKVDITVMRCVLKVSRLKLYLTRQKWKMNETLIFFKIAPNTFDVLIPMSFPLVFDQWKTHRNKYLWNFFWYSVKMCCWIFKVLKYSHWDEFSVYENRNDHMKLGLVSKEHIALAQSCVSPKTYKVWRIGTDLSCHYYFIV